jgi:nitroreductase
MDTFEAIRKRRSVRSYTGEPIPKGDLEKIVEAGRWAPSGYNRQPWDFIVVTNKEMIDNFKIAAQWIVNAGAVIAVVLDSNASKFWLEDGSAAIENMLLASTALGYGSCWLEGDSEPHEKEFKKLLGVPAQKRLLTLIPIGVPTHWPEKEKKSLDKVLHWERYGGQA